MGPDSFLFKRERLFLTLFFFFFSLTPVSSPLSFSFFLFALEWQCFVRRATAKQINSILPPMQKGIVAISRRVHSTRTTPKRCSTTYFYQAGPSLRRLAPPYHASMREEDVACLSHRQLFDSFLSRSSFSSSALGPQHIRSGHALSALPLNTSLIPFRTVISPSPPLLCLFSASLATRHHFAIPTTTCFDFASHAAHPFVCLGTRDPSQTLCHVENPPSSSHNEAPSTFHVTQPRFHPIKLIVSTIYDRCKESAW